MLQQSEAIASDAWTTVTHTPVQMCANLQVILSIKPGDRFYRLALLTAPPAQMKRLHLLNLQEASAENLGTMPSLCRPEGRLKESLRKVRQPCLGLREFAVQ